MSSFTIRLAKVSDAHALSEFGARTFAETFGAENRPEDLDAHIRSTYGVTQQKGEIEDKDVVTLLAFHGEELVGSAQVQRRSAPSCVVIEQPIELLRFYLAQSVHGSGLASSLMLAARASAKELGGLHLWLGVWERNPRAIAFYKKTGFVPAGSHVFMVGSDSQTDLVLISPLSNKSEVTA